MPKIYMNVLPTTREVLFKNKLVPADIDEVHEGLNLIRDKHGVEAAAIVRSVFETVAQLRNEVAQLLDEANAARDTGFIDAAEQADAKESEARTKLADIGAILVEVLR